jgi:phage minor structural protein
MLKVYDKNLLQLGVLGQATDVQRRRRLNSDYDISFVLPMSSDNYDITEIKGHIKDERGQYYVINERARKREGVMRLVQFDCIHIMFKMVDIKFPYASYIDEAYGVHISTLLDAISAATGGKFTFAVDDTFELKDIKDFGRGNCLQALNFIVEKYGCEIDPDNFDIHVKKKIGMDRGFQARLKKNIINVNFRDSSRALVTRMYSQMKDGLTFVGLPASNLTTEEYNLLNAIPGAIVGGIIKANYLISPYAATWSNTTNTYYDGEFMDQNIEDPLELLNATRKSLREQELPAIDVPLNVADLHKIDREEPEIFLGDTIRIFDSGMQINDISARVMEITEYPFDPGKQPNVTLANYFLRDYQDIIADLDKSKQIVDRIISGGKVLTSAFESVAAQAIYDINNSKTELIYPPEGGILARDKVNPLNQVRLTSTGIGVSTDGWQTIRSAITATGVVAEVIVGILGEFAQVKTDNLIAGTVKIGSALIDSIKANQIDVTGGRIIATQIDATNLHVSSANIDGTIVADIVKANWVYTGGLNASQITAGQISAQFINTVNLAAEKIYQAGTPNNYAVMGGSYGDMVLYKDNSEFFRVYNEGTISTELWNRGNGFLRSGVGPGLGTRPLGSWDFSSSSIASGSIPTSAIAGLESRLQYLENSCFKTARRVGNLAYFDSKNITSVDFVDVSG